MCFWRCGGLLLALSAIALFVGVPGCGRKAGSNVDPVSPKPDPVKFVFFDGERPLPPTEWAKAQAPLGINDGAKFLGLLQVDDVWRARMQETDPMPFFRKDIGSLLALGQCGRLPLNWIETLREGNVVYLDSIRMPDGRLVQGEMISAYFFSLRSVIERGAAAELDPDGRLADAMFNAGYAIYFSDDSLGSASPRQSMLTSAWLVAMLLREQQALSRGDHAEAAVWKQRGEECQELYRYLNALRSHLISVRMNSAD